MVALCGAAGMALAGWVVRTRRLVTARAALERWRPRLPPACGPPWRGRVLAAESVLLAAHAEVLPVAESAGDPAPTRRSNGGPANWVACARTGP